MASEPKPASVPASQRAALDLAAVLLRARQRPKVAAFEALRWHSLASEKALCVPASKAVPLARHCKRATRELRAQLALCREAVLSSNKAADRALLGRRCQLQPPIENGDILANSLPGVNGGVASSGSAATSSACAPRAGTGAYPASDDHMEPATVWHPPGNEDEAMWKELALLVEGLSEDNPKWANCLARVVQRLEASHTACRKQRDCLLEAAIPQARESRVVAEAAQVDPQMPPSEFNTDEIIFAGYGRAAAVAAPTATPSLAELARAAAAPSAELALGADAGSGRPIGSGVVAAASRVDVVSSPEAATVAAANAQAPLEDSKPSPLCFGPATPARTTSAAVPLLPTGAMPHLPSALSPANGPPHRSPQPVPVPSVQISLLAVAASVDSAEGAATGQAAAEVRVPTSSTDSSSEESDYNIADFDDDRCAEAAALEGARAAAPAVGPTPVIQTAPLEQPDSEIERPAPARSPRLHSDNTKTPEKTLASLLDNVASQNVFEAEAPVLAAAATSSSQSSAANLGGTSSLSASLGLVWPPATLYTPRTTATPNHIAPRIPMASDDGVDKYDGVLDVLSRSATALPHPYTPRQKPTTRLGMAPVRNQTSRAGSLRYPPTGMSRPFGVQRMASGTLSQPSNPPQSLGVAPSPRQLGPATSGSAVEKSKRIPVRIPSVSASHRRASGHGQQGLGAHLSLQWPGAARPASAVAPAAVNPGASGAPRGSGVSRQSSAPGPITPPPSRASAESAAAAVAAHSPALSTAAAEMLPAYLSAGALGLAGDHARRTSAAAVGSASVPGSASGPVGGSGIAVPSRGTPAAAVPKIHTNGLTSCFSAKPSQTGAPPPQTPMPTAGKGYREGYSSIQLWTPRPQRQLGDMKQVGETHSRQRELSMEPPQVGRSPSASLSSIPATAATRSWSMGIHGASPLASPPMVAAAALRQAHRRPP